MHSSSRLVAAFVVLSSTLSLAQPRGEVVIQQHGGRALVGRVISETSKGYLVATSSGTEVVEFASIADIRQLAPVTAPVAAPVAQASLTPAPQPRRAAPQPVPAYLDEPTSEQVEVREVVEPVKPRTSKGFHFGLGASFAGEQMLGLFGAGPQAHTSFEFNFGRPAYRINANVGLTAGHRGFVNLSVDNLFIFSLGQHFSLGAGLQVGGAIGDLKFFQISPLLTPAILKLGERGQHQIAVTGSVVALSTYTEDYVTDWKTLTTRSFLVSSVGSVRVALGYTYFF